MYEICIQNLKVVCKTKPAANLSQALFKWLLSVLPKTSRRRRQTFGLQALQSKALYGVLDNFVLRSKALLWYPCASKNFVQTFGLQALQSKALYGGKTPHRRWQNSSPKVAKLRANLWFASLTKQSFVWRQNFSPKAAKLLAIQSFAL